MSTTSANLAKDRRKTKAELLQELASLRRTVAELQATPIAEPRASEEEYRALYDHIPLMYFTMDREGVILSVNAHGAEQLGYRQEELVGQAVLTVFHEEDRPAVERGFTACVNNPGKVIRWDYRKVRKDGSVLWVHESARAIQTRGQTVVLVVCEDVTKRKQTEQKLSEQRQRLRTLASDLVLAEERERKRIATGLHDQIGQNLGLVRQSLDNLLGAKRFGELAPRFEEIRARVDQAIEATRSLTFELSSPVLYELGLEAALQDLGERMADRNGVRFQFETDGRTEAPIDDASVVLFRAVRELLFNIAKHAQAQNVRMAVERIEDRLRIWLEDDGVGFDRATIDGALSRSGGFGLFNTREQLEEISGRFEIDTAPGKGTRVVLEAPLSRAGKAQPGGAESRRES
jgi:PAS domain S-box-containing protein